MNAPRVRLIGCGSPDGGDDAIGLVVVRQLRERLPPEVEVKTDPAGGAKLVNWCNGVEVLIIVDAALATESFPAGQWRRFSFPAERDCFKKLAFRNTHALGLVESLELAARLDLLPAEVVIFAVAGSQFEPRAGCSAAVQKSLPAVRATVETEILSRLREFQP